VFEGNILLPFAVPTYFPVALRTTGCRIGLGSFRWREELRGPRDRTCRGYLVRENPWLQLQGTRRVLLNVRYARIATKLRSAAK
jgi:hypothetical protein